MSRSLLFCVVAALFVCLCASLPSASYYQLNAKTPSSQPSTLVLLDSLATKQTHSIFFRKLKAQGHQLTFAHINDDNVKLEKYGAFFYDNLVLFAPSAEDFGETLTAAILTNFLDSGRSVLVAVNEKVTEPLREMLNEIGIDIDEEGTAVQDHAQFDTSSSDHTIVLGRVAVDPATSILGSSSGPSAPVLFKGIGHAATDSRLLTRVLTGSDTAFSYAVGKQLTEYPQAAGRDSLLVTVLQTRTNARLAFSGSLDLFSNEFLLRPVNEASHGKQYAKSGNEEFVTELAQWTFHYQSVIRARDLTHRKAGGDANPSSYRVQDFLEFSIVLEEFDGSTNTWVPFTQKDVQLEFTMIDPYVRLNLNTTGNGVYTANFQVPDVYGVFKFVINYYRVGYSNLEISHTVPVHPFRHNEFERFIQVAYPYYLSAFTVMAAFFVFGIVFLYQKDN